MTETQQDLVDLVAEPANKVRKRYRAFVKHYVFERRSLNEVGEVVERSNSRGTYLVLRIGNGKQAFEIYLFPTQESADEV